MTTSEAPLPPSPQRPWLRWALLGSLMLNGLLGGYAIGRLSGPPHWPPFPRPPMMGEQAPPPFSLSGVPAPLRDAMRDRLREGRPDMRARVDSLRAARAATRDAIAAEPFDPKRLEAAFAALRSVQGAVQEDLHGVAVEAVTRMSAEERKRIAEWRGPDGMMRDGREPREPRNR